MSLLITTERETAYDFQCILRSCFLSSGTRWHAVPIVTVALWLLIVGHLPLVAIWIEMERVHHHS